MASELQKRLGITVETPSSTPATKENAEEKTDDVVEGKIKEGGDVALTTDGALKSTPAEKAASDKGSEPPIDEDAIALRIFNRKNGTDYATLDEALAAMQSPKPAEDEEMKKKKREVAKLKFALESDKFSKDDYDAYQRDAAKDARDIVYDDFYKKQKAAGKSPEQIERAFIKYWGEDLSEEEDEELTAVQQMRREDMTKEKERILRKKYASIYNLDKEYDQHELSQKAAQTQKQRLTTNTRQYAEDLKNIFDTNKKRTIRFGDASKPDEVFETEFTYKPELIKQVEQEFSDSKTVAGFIENYDRSTLAEAIRIRLETLSLADFTENTAKKYHAKKTEEQIKKRKHLIADNVDGTPGEIRNNLSPEMKRRLGIAEVPSTQTN